MKTQQFVYVGQYGTIWRLPRRVWVELCKAGAEGKGYELPDQYRLARPPRGFYRAQHADHITNSNEFSAPPGVTYLEPLDWAPDSFANWLSENGWTWIDSSKALALLDRLDRAAALSESMLQQRMRYSGFETGRKAHVRYDHWNEQYKRAFDELRTEIAGRLSKCPVVPTDSEDRSI
ncbi:MAG: hypothetical protein ACJ8R9_05620 [Steroidobacteraceae bacterium]